MHRERFKRQICRVMNVIIRELYHHTLYNDRKTLFPTPGY